jgi:sarcosine oxidase subunit gamma
MVELASRRLPTVPINDWLKPLSPAVRFAFYGDSVAQAKAAPVWGTGFSSHACRAEVSDTRAALWLGPDEYLLLDLGTPPVDGDPPEPVVPPAAATFAALERALGDIPHALVDVSHRQFAFQLTGPHAANILNGACPLDLDLSAFPVGMCTRTVFAKADIVLWRTTETVFHVEVWRSFAGYVTGLMSEIAAEFYPAR